jgi:hypothetical protein
MRPVLALVPLALVGAYAVHSTHSNAPAQAPSEAAVSSTMDSRATNLRSDDVHIRGGARATLSISLDGSLDVLRRELESWDGESDLDLAHLAFSGNLVADIVAAFDGSLEIEDENGRTVLTAHMGDDGLIVH